MKSRFDAIVVGAGPAGSAAALGLARGGARVLCLERGEYPGAKNVSGGVLHGDLLRELAGEGKGEIPLERRIVRHNFHLSDQDNLLSFSHQPLGGSRPDLGWSVLRTRFDSWLSRLAQAAGARLLTEAPADDLIWRDGRAVGLKVRRPEGQVAAPVIILADGANSLLSRKAGLRPAFRTDQMLLAVKEVIKLPGEVIDSRFNLSREEGAAGLMVGQASNGLEGGGFLYTNRESLSLGLACYLDALIREKVKIHDLLERFKCLDWVAPLIEGGTLKEYSAHLIPSQGFRERPRLFGPGLLVAGDAAGLTLNNGLILRGMDLALASGLAAAETALAALERGDFSARTLAGYEDRLRAGPVWRDLETFARAKGALRNRALYAVYPGLLGGVLAEALAAGRGPQERTGRLLWRRLRRDKMAVRFIKDGLKTGRAL